MNIKLIEGIHLTATNKRHLSQMIENGMTTAASGRINYTLKAGEVAGEYNATITTKEVGMFGQKVNRRHSVKFRAA